MGGLWWSDTDLRGTNGLESALDRSGSNQVVSNLVIDADRLGRWDSNPRVFILKSGATLIGIQNENNEYLSQKTHLHAGKGHSFASR